MPTIIIGNHSLRLIELCEKMIDDEFENYTKEKIFDTVTQADKLQAKQLRDVSLFMMASSLKNCRTNKDNGESLYPRIASNCIV